MRQVPFSEMWQLIVKNHREYVAVFTPELLVGLFWEETAFRNMRGIISHYMVGFGQVSTSNFERLRRYFGGQTKYTPEMILADDNLSVEITSKALRAIFETNGASRKVRSLNVYARNDLSDAPLPVVRKWLAVERELLLIGLRRGDITAQLTNVEVVKRVQTALTLARPKAQFSPELAFPFK